VEEGSAAPHPHTHTHTRARAHRGQDPLMETTGFSQQEMEHLPQHITLRKRESVRGQMRLDETEPV